jgi:hypothetical protein
MGITRILGNNSRWGMVVSRTNVVYGSSVVIRGWWFVKPQIQALRPKPQAILSNPFFPEKSSPQESLRANHSEKSAAIARGGLKCLDFAVVFIHRLADGSL